MAAFSVSSLFHRGILFGLLLAITTVLAQAQPRFPQPAEAPEVIVMQRPSKAEITRAEQVLDDFMNGLSKNETALFEKYPYLLEVRPPAARNSAIIPNLSPRFEARHQANLAEEIAEGVGAVVLELQTRFPAAKILLLTIFPRSTHDDPLREKLGRVNSIITGLDDGETVFFRDIGEIFLDENGDIPVEIMSDGLHPTTRGYWLWAEEFIAPLTALME